ncbi:hypothetical protein [Streptomyces pseudogriseolus]|uniref:hypothetical protein n=1 Tax=Streptomyces pseudogriseolus TaxID=36817 RepID=UPI003FA23D66
MGDHFQTIVDLDAGPDEAAAYAERGLAWLISEGIVNAERTDCVLGAPLGHPPGPNWLRACSPADEEWEPSDGLNVEVGRTVFNGGQGEPEAVTCPRCEVTTRLMTDTWAPDDEAWAPFGAALHDWDDTGEAEVVCPACAASVPLPEYRWADDYFAFAHLGFEFWNWPEFTEEFLTRFSDALGGHRVRRVWGKL